MAEPQYSRRRCSREIWANIQVFCAPEQYRLTLGVIGFIEEVIFPKTLDFSGGKKNCPQKFHCVGLLKIGDDFTIFEPPPENRIARHVMVASWQSDGPSAALRAVHVALWDLGEG
jgi:hypothetical protein